MQVVENKLLELLQKAWLYQPVHYALCHNCIPHLAPPAKLAAMRSNSAVCKGCEEENVNQHRPHSCRWPAEGQFFFTVSSMRWSVHRLRCTWIQSKAFSMASNETRPLQKLCWFHLFLHLLMIAWYTTSICTVVSISSISIARALQATTASEQGKHTNLSKTHRIQQPLTKTLLYLQFRKEVLCVACQEASFDFSSVTWF